MKTLHLLIGGIERNLNRLIEATVLDVCYNRAAVACTKVARPGEFLRHGGGGGYELLILNADHLQPESGHAEPGEEQLVQTVWSIKNCYSAPLIVLGCSAELEYRFLEAGADAVLPGRWKGEELRLEVQRLLTLPAEEPVHRRSWSLAGLFGK